MISSLKDQRLLESCATSMGGVFSKGDLQTILAPSNPGNFLRRIRRLEEAGVLQRFVRGIYVTESFDLPSVSQKLCPESYISLGNALARQLAIGTIPAKRIFAIKVGKRREYRSKLGTIIHLGISRSLFFAYERENGICWAEKEKALLDTLYFHVRGQRYFFDIYSDIDLSQIDRKKLLGYLSRYKNRKFQTFVRRYLNENATTK